MSVREKDDPILFQRVQEQNLLRQYDLAFCFHINTFTPKLSEMQREKLLLYYNFVVDYES
jgi:hypothetical protein